MHSDDASLLSFVSRALWLWLTLLFMASRLQRLPYMHLCTVCDRGNNYLILKYLAVICSLCEFWSYRVWPLICCCCCCYLNMHIDCECKHSYCSAHCQKRRATIKITNLKWTHGKDPFNGRQCIEVTPLCQTNATLSRFSADLRVEQQLYENYSNGMQTTKTFNAEKTSRKNKNWNN